MKISELNPSINFERVFTMDWESTRALKVNGSWKTSGLLKVYDQWIVQLKQGPFTLCLGQVLCEWSMGVQLNGSN